jgi:carnitine O-palmitoyltransferase 1, liver isoform
MAEARNAIEYTKQKRNFDLFLVNENNDGTVTLTLTLPHPYRWRRQIVKIGYRWRNVILYGLWPASPITLLIVTITLVLIALFASPTSWWRTGWLAQILTYSNQIFWPKELVKHIPQDITIGYLAALGSIWIVFIIMALERGLLRMVLSWHGWMYRSKLNHMSTRTWQFATKVLTGFQNPRLTYSFQSSLPNLPVPDLQSTVTTFLESVKPILGDKEFFNLKDLGETFIVNNGQKINQYLKIRSWLWSTNYVSDIWEKYVWLRARNSLCINSNYYMLDFCDFAPSRIGVARAATLTALMVDFHRLLQKEHVEPIRIRGIRPICMNQYERMFGTTRIPGKENDVIKHRGDSAKHIVVIRRGVFFKIEVIRWDGRVSKPCEIEEQFAHVKQVADQMHNLGQIKELNGKYLASLTAASRTMWAEVREDNFSEGINKISLDEIETALFVVVLDKESPTTWRERGSLTMHGDGTNRWFDKSVSLIVYENGHAGLNAEHSWADAPVVAHMWEHCLCHEIERNGKFSYQKDGHASNRSTKDNNDDVIPKTILLNKVKILTFHLNPSACKSTRTALAFAKNLINDLQLEIFGHVDYGKGLIKKNCLSPDAFIQMAYQLAYYKVHGTMALTYEACMTRMFRNGRTETVRVLSAESVDFVKSMLAGNTAGNNRPNNEDISNATKLELLQKACAKHQNSYIDAMCGRGVERHIFAMYVVSMSMDAESEFLQNALKIPWRMSTSQQPQRQTKIWNIVPKEIDDICISPGGGFGPVTDDGYGISYMFAGEDKIFFHVSSKRSSPMSDSEKFLNVLNRVLKEMKDLLLFNIMDKGKKGV